MSVLLNKGMNAHTKRLIKSDSKSMFERHFCEKPDYFNVSQKYAKSIIL